MLSFSLTFSHSRDEGKIASLRIYFPFDEIVTIDFSEAGPLMALLTVLKQEALISEVRRFLWSSQPEEPFHCHQLTNQAVA
jgi:hypothetical protein